MPTTEMTPRSPAESARTSLEEVRDALRELTQAVMRLERTTRAARRKGQTRRAMTEIGEVVFKCYEHRRTATKTSLWGSSREEEVTEPDGRLIVAACGPRGKYTAGVSDPLPTESLYGYEGKKWPERWPANVRSNQETTRILDDFLAQLWRDGWQPTSFAAMRRGRYSGEWYNVALRRTVVEADGPSTELTTSQREA